MLLLGAGASKPFEIPTMQDLTVEIPKALKDNEKWEVTRILGRLIQSGFKDADIEAVMDVLTAKEDLNRAKRSIGPRIIEFVEENTNHSPDTKANLLLESIKEAIEARCSKANFVRSDSYFEQFFNQTAESTYSMDGGRVVYPYQHIFTTNYDLCVERFLRKHNPNYWDGFEAKPGYGRVFTGVWPDNPQGYSLCKLHGSVDWFEIEGGPILQLPGTPKEGLYGDTIKGRTMVYPAGEKYALRSPYAECLFYLRSCLRDERKCVAVGYSFRDDPINNAFIDAFRLNSNLKIFSLGPRASKHAQDLPDPLKSRIVSVDTEFGTTDAFRMLREARQANQ